MKQHSTENNFFAKAQLTSYFALCFGFALPILLCIYLIIRDGVTNLQRVEDSYVILAGCLTCCLLFVVWLRGFRIEISNGVFYYRNGFYQTSKLQLNEIKDAKIKSVNIIQLGCRVSVPRMRVTTFSNSEILINIKPFSIGKIRELKSLLNHNDITPEDTRFFEEGETKNKT
jgi:uncharacterized membrane protein YobD (UPF0266 family)